jgi:hypothetical protein
VAPLSKGNTMGPFSSFWYGLASGSADLAPSVGSAALDGLFGLPAYILETLGGGAALFGS